MSHRYRTPANSLAAIVVVSWLFSVAAFIVGTGTAIVIVHTRSARSSCTRRTASSSTSVRRRPSGATERVWSLGGCRKPVAALAVFWVIVLMVLFSWPTSGNISFPFMAVTAILLVIYYFAWARSRFKGPQVQGAEGELTEIEREFQKAAEGLTTS